MKIKNIENQNHFLQQYIDNEMYLQNPPLTTGKFIDFCRRLGIYISKEELEFFEKENLLYPIARIDRPVEEEEWLTFKKEDGKEYSRLADVGLKEGETEVERCKVRSYSTYNVFKEDVVGSYYKDLLLRWLEEGNLFDPSTREFQNWDTFHGETLDYDSQKIVSFYSTFQIWQLVNIKQLNTVRFTHNITNFHINDCNTYSEDGKVYLKASLELKINLYDEEETPQSEKSPHKSKQENRALIDRFSKGLDIDEKKETWNRHDNFKKIFKFLLSVQSAYFPYAKSGSGKIQSSIDGKKWVEVKHNIDLEKILEECDLKIEEVANWYKLFSDKAQQILGIKRDDWIQLLKNISWSKKDELEGNTRLGVEYLQWAVMLKRILEEHLQKEVLDIDEMSNISGNDVLKFEPAKMNQFGSLRAFRNNKYSDQDKNYYYDRHKRIFYLANDFGLDYQPRVTIFVEGKTEEIVFPEIFEKYAGNKTEDLGIEFISINGISQFFGGETSLKNSHGSYDKKFISNFNHLASYNLNKWQIIPYFIGDEENNISHLLQSGIAISFNQKQYSHPIDWQYIWGLTNNNNPFQGKDFEMANFSNDEIADVLSEILIKEIKPSDVQAKRSSGQGIKQVCSEVVEHKVDIARKMVSNLFNKHKETKDDSLLQRPIFVVIDNIRELAIINHPPVSRDIQLKNKKYIQNELQKP
ncbi:MAG: TOPRIM nucleotidyl transferase/hydrolase domain-containing protein [Thermoleophilia bacterium]